MTLQPYASLFILHRICVLSASHAVGRQFAPRSGHTKNHDKNGTICFPAWPAGVTVGV